MFIYQKPLFVSFSKAKEILIESRMKNMHLGLEGQFLAISMWDFHSNKITCFPLPAVQFSAILQQCSWDKPMEIGLSQFQKYFEMPGLPWFIRIQTEDGHSIWRLYLHSAATKCISFNLFSVNFILPSKRRGWGAIIFAIASIEPFKSIRSNC